MTLNYNQNYFQCKKCKFWFGYHKQSKKYWQLYIRPQRRPIWKRKGNIPMARIYSEVEVSHPNRIQLKFEDCVWYSSMLIQIGICTISFFIRVLQGAKYIFRKMSGNENNTFFDLDSNPKGSCEEGGVWSSTGAYLFQLRPYWAIWTQQPRKKLDFEKKHWPPSELRTSA
jgi:hypothetical protein